MHSTWFCEGKPQKKKKIVYLLYCLFLDLVIVKNWTIYVYSWMLSVSLILFIDFKWYF